MSLDTVQAPIPSPETSGRPAYELRGVTKRFGSGGGAVEAVRDLDLTIAEGEFVAIAGPSGSGKTTLLQLLGLLDRPTSGQILCCGSDVAKLGDGELSRLRLHTVGFVFQQFNLIPTLTAQANVEAALAPAGMKRAEGQRRAQELLDSVGLGGRASHLPSQLSGGEQQRVAIARALANNPSILLADEPTGNLDSATGEEILKLLRSLSEDRSRTVIVVTHDAEIAAAAPRVIRLRDGGIDGPQPLAPSEAS